MARVRIGLLVTAGVLCSAPALGGFFEDLYRGLDVVSTPTGSPLQAAPGGGRANGNRFGRFRIVPNQLGEGYRLELDRNFGADSRGRPEVFDLGNFELELSGVTSVTLGYTSRGILTGNADIFANNLAYTLREKSGAQDFALQGTLNVNERVEVNPLGFYSVQLDISNTNSALTGNGLAVEGDLDTDFDIGPVTVRGNVFFDAALALLTSFGVDTDSLEGIFPDSPIDRINDEIEAFFREQGRVLGTRMSSDGQLATLTAGGALNARAFSGSAGGSPHDATSGTGLLVPEPLSIALLGVGGLLGLRRRA